MLIEVQSEVKATARAVQLAGMFDLKLADASRMSWDVDLPLSEKPWNVGLIVGPSGSGKTQIASHLFAPAPDFQWSADRALGDEFPSEMNCWQVSEALSNVGLGSVPSWLRPYHVLSNGEQFRARMARLITTIKPEDAPVYVDEFTSVVDRDVARTASVAISKAIRRRNLKAVFCSCHFDITDWLQPDWILQLPRCEFQWRELQRRPSIQLEIRRVGREAWGLFSQHHYLSHSLNKGSRCFVALWDGRPVALSAWMVMPAVTPMFREHRTVTLPDFQGIGLGNVISDFAASVVTAIGYRARSTTAHPGMIFSRSRSNKWISFDTFSVNPKHSNHAMSLHQGERRTMSFEYCGPAADVALARELWRKDFQTLNFDSEVC